MSGQQKNLSCANTQLNACTQRKSHVTYHKPLILPSSTTFGYYYFSGAIVTVQRVWRRLQISRLIYVYLDQLMEHDFYKLTSLPETPTGNFKALKAQKKKSYVPLMEVQRRQERTRRTCRLEGILLCLSSRPITFSISINHSCSSRIIHCQSISHCTMRTTISALAARRQDARNSI